MISEVRRGKLDFYSVLNQMRFHKLYDMVARLYKKWLDDGGKTLMSYRLLWENKEIYKRKNSAKNKRFSFEKSV